MARLKSNMNTPITLAVQTIVDRDPILAPVIAGHDVPSFVPHTNYYQELVESIISQQLSVKAAASIRKRFVELFDGIFPSPERIIDKTIEQLRGVGLSRGKSVYIQDLARHIIDGTLNLDALDTLSNDEIIDKLTQVKGIGVWTAHMFLMFCMGRLDILPVGDLGIRSGIKKLYDLETLPAPSDIELIAREYNWHPYESIASWYVWKSLENAPIGASRNE